MPIRLPARRPGFTLIELALVLVIVGLASLVGIRQLQHFLDRIATRDAARAAGAFIARARDEAIALHTAVSVRVDTAAAALELRARERLIDWIKLNYTCKML